VRGCRLASVTHERLKPLGGRTTAGYLSEVREFLLVSCVAWLVVACSPDLANGEHFELGSGEDTDSPGDSAPARGIAIREIELNQGVRVVVGQGGDWIDADQRTLGLIGSRDALLRVHTTVDPEWTPREVTARLTLEHADGTIEALEQTKQVEGDSTPDPLEGGFWFQLRTDAGQTLPDTRYRVELWDPSGATDLPELDWANPAQGAMPIGFEAIPLELKVVFVPIHYVALDSTPALDDEALALLVDSLYEQNPVNQVSYAVRDSVDYASTLDDVASLLPLLSQLKTADGADANTYYHALVDIGAPSLGGRRGIGNIVGDSEGEGADRVAATLYWTADPSLAAETFNHEVGHNQGLAHVQCPNAAADGIDPSYPHVDGTIGSWGAGVRRLEVFDPDRTYDYMSYCGPSWVSDWTWAKTHERIATLTAWDLAASEPAGMGWILMGMRELDGRTQWWLARGEIDPERVSARDRVRLSTDQGEHVDAWVQVERSSEAGFEWIKVELPLDFDRIRAITYLRDEAAIEVPIDAVVTPLAHVPATIELRTRRAEPITARTGPSLGPAPVDPRPARPGRSGRSE